MVGKTDEQKALRKDFYMEIRRSLGRFLSIFSLSLSDVRFFRHTRLRTGYAVFGRRIFDNKNMMDIQVISTMGFSEEDLSAIKAVDGIEYAKGDIPRTSSVRMGRIRSLSM